MTFWEQASIDKKKLEETLSDLEIQRHDLEQRRQEVEEALYQTRLRVVYLEEIYRLAGIQFNRLRREAGTNLREEDVRELEKWIGRTKSNEGLQDIVEALKEVQKYRPIDIKSNLYALIQKIIIGGAFHQKGERK